jgi:hypothetical protein
MTAEALIGRWNIVSWEQRYDDGRVMFPMGHGLSGFILYSSDGTMACFIAKSERPRFASGMQWDATVAEKAAAYESIMAYGGHFVVNGDSVEHHVETSAFPNWVGGVQKRKFNVDGDRLSISAGLEAGTSEARIALLEWTRAA